MPKQLHFISNAANTLFFFCGILKIGIACRCTRTLNESRDSIVLRPLLRGYSRKHQERACWESPEHIQYILHSVIDHLGQANNPLERH